MLSRIYWPDFPVPVGVILDVKRATHDELLTAQREEAVAKRGSGDLRALLEGGETWVVAAGVIRCPSCGHANFAGEDSCEACGADLPDPRRARRCGRLPRAASR